MTEQEYLEELKYLVQCNMLSLAGLGYIRMKREGKPINSELAILEYLSEKYLKYKKDLKLFKKMKLKKI